MERILPNAEPGVAFLLGPRLQVELEHRGEEVVVPEGAVLFHQGATCQGVYVLRSGTARIYIVDAQGRMITCRNVAAGSILGLPATLCQQPYMFTAETTSECSFGFIPAEEFQEFLRVHPELCMEIVQLMSRELAAVNRKRTEASSCAHTDCNLRGACTSCN